MVDGPRPRYFLIYQGHHTDDRDGCLYKIN